MGSQLLNRIIKTLSKRDLKSLGLEGKFKASDIHNKLIEHFSTHTFDALDDEINSILSVGLMQVCAVDCCGGNDVAKITKPVPQTQAIDEETFKEQHPDAIPVMNYGEWTFDNVFYDEGDGSWWERTKNKYKQKNLQVINRKESAVSVKDCDSVRRYIYIDKYIKANA
jgi:hypothetical protein